jgi:hypothetical protein
MTSIRKEVAVDAKASAIWDAVRDVGAIHQRLATGFVTDTRIDGDSRIVTFANGLVARELIVAIDEPQMRLAYAIVDGVPRHYHGSIQVVGMGAGSSRVVWIIDVLPDELAPRIAGMMDLGVAAMKRTLESADR